MEVYTHIERFVRYMEKIDSNPRTRWLYRLHLVLFGILCAAVYDFVTGS